MFQRRPAEPWIADEPRFGDTVGHVASRALRRPILALAVAVSLTTLLVAARVKRAPIYEATAYFRMVEGDVGDPNATPRPPRLIREYIDSVALSQQTLLAIMKKHNLYRKIRERDLMLAIDSMREDIDVKVARSYFIYDRRPDDEPRSASIEISYTFGNGEVARAVVHELGQAVLDAQFRQRNARLDAERQLNQAELEHVKRQVKGVQAGLDLLYLDGVDANGPALVGNHAQVAAAESRLRSVLARLHTLEKHGGELELATAVEDKRLGISFQLVDEETEVRGAQLTARQIIKLTAAIFLCVLVLTLIVLGGWGRRVYTAADLAAAGLPILGTLESFPGDEVGSYRSRTAKRRGNPSILRR